MIGKPKYKYKDIVEFRFNEYMLKGTIEIVDAYGTFEQNKEPSYDIFVENSPHFNGDSCLYKHILESSIIKRIKNNKTTAHNFI